MKTPMMVWMLTLLFLTAPAEALCAASPYLGWKTDVSGTLQIPNDLTLKMFGNRSEIELVLTFANEESI